MKNKNLNHILFWIFVLTISFLLNSCGARKAEKIRNSDSSKTELTDKSSDKIKEESNVKSTKQTTVDDKNETITEKETIEPIDPTKPAIHTDSNGKKTELNNSKKTTEKTTRKNNTQTKEDSVVVVTKKKEVDKKADTSTKTAFKKEVKNIKVDREAFSMWNFFWLLIPVGIYLLYRKYKNKIWWL